MRKILFTLFTLFIISLVSAAPFTPQGDIDLRNVYGVFNATSYTGDNMILEGNLTVGGDITARY